MYATGILKDSTGTPPLGLEIAGKVVQIGANVRKVSVGDRVLAMPPSACAKTVVKVPSTLVQAIPEHLSFEDAATMPICYSTVIESLINIGRLKKGQVGLCFNSGPSALHLILTIICSLFLYILPPEV